jgi:hypothetical protein
MLDPKVRLGADREHAPSRPASPSRQHFPSILNALERGETLVEVV